MITKELLAYIKSRRAIKDSHKDIIKTLKMQGGWSTDDIAEAFAIVAKEGKDINTTNTIVSNPAVNKETTKDEKKDRKEDAAVAATKTKKDTKRKHKVLCIMTFAILIIIVIGGVVFGYYSLNKDSKEKTPHDVLMVVLENYNNTTSFTQEGSVRFAGEVEVPKKYLIANGVLSTEVEEFSALSTDIIKEDKLDADITEVIQMIWVISYDIDIDTTENLLGEGTIDMSMQGMSASSSFDIKTVVDGIFADGALYIQIQDNGESDDPEYIGKWFSVDVYEMLRNTGINIDELTETNKLYQNEFSDMIRQFLDDPETVDMINRTFVSVDEDWETDYHYRIKLTRSDWEFLVRKIFQAKHTAVSQDELLEKTEDKVLSLFASPKWNALVEILEETTFSVRVDKTHLLFQKIQMLLHVERFEINEALFTVSIDADIVFPDYGIPVEVHIPDAAPLDLKRRNIDEYLFGEN